MGSAEDPIKGSFLNAVAVDRFCSVLFPLQMSTAMHPGGGVLFPPTLLGVTCPTERHRTPARSDPLRCRAPERVPEKIRTLDPELQDKETKCRRRAECMAMKARSTHTHNEVCVTTRNHDSDL